MKYVPRLALLIFGMLTATTHSQSYNFEGRDVQLGLGYQSTRGTANMFDGASGAAAVSNATMGSLATTLGASYTTALSNQITLGAIFESSPLKLKAGSASVSPPAPYTVNAYDETFKNVYNLSLVPGYAIDKSRLAYAKLGYTYAAAIFTSNDGSADSSAKLNGYNLGLGMRVDTGNFYPFAELNYIKFLNLTNAMADTTGRITQGGSGYNLLAGVGYHF